MSVKTVKPRARNKLVDYDETKNINEISEIYETEDGETDCDIINSEIRKVATKLTLLQALVLKTSTNPLFVELNERFSMLPIYSFV